MKGLAQEHTAASWLPDPRFPRGPSYLQNSSVSFLVDLDSQMSLRTMASCDKPEDVAPPEYWPPYPVPVSPGTWDPESQDPVLIAHM